MLLAEMSLGDPVKYTHYGLNRQRVQNSAKLDNEIYKKQMGHVKTNWFSSRVCV